MLKENQIKKVIANLCAKGGLATAANRGGVIPVYLTTKNNATFRNTGKYAGNIAVGFNDAVMFVRATDQPLTTTDVSTIYKIDECCEGCNSKLTCLVDKKNAGSE